MRNLRKFTIGLGLALAVAGGAHAQGKAILSSWLEPNHPLAIYGSVAWAEDIKEATDGEVDFEVILGSALMPAAAHMQGTADGLAQVGGIAATYLPSDLPITNALADAGFINPNTFALAFGFTDFMMNEKIGYDEWRDNGVIFGGGWASPPYYFICNKELETLADFEGARVRTAGGGAARFSDALGAVNVAISSAEMYTAMERGAIDCTLSDATHLTGGATLLEVTKAVTMLPTGPFYAAAVWMFNPDWWQGLTDAQRRIVFDATATAIVRFEIAYVFKEEKRSLDAAVERGVKLIEPADDLKAFYDQWVADGVGDMAGVARERHGIEDPEALFALFNTYIDKWANLLEGVELDNEEEMVALVKANLFDLLDEKTYGMD